MLYSSPTLSLAAYQFADDTILISDAHTRNLRVIVELLKRYATLTRLSIKPTKSVLIPIAITPSLHDMLGILWLVWSKRC